MAVEMEPSPGTPLSFAELPFDQAEPTEEALVELAGLAERCFVSPGGSS